MTQHLKTKYADLIRSYSEHQIDASEFEKRYLDTFKHETGSMSFGEYTILNELFGVVERFCNDPSLRTSDDADEDELQAAAVHALRNLARL